MRRSLLSSFKQNPFDLLGVSQNASEDDIRKAYRDKALLFHPDRNPSIEAKERFKIISNAYDQIKDSNRRAILLQDMAYDQDDDAWNKKSRYYNNNHRNTNDVSGDFNTAETSYKARSKRSGSSSMKGLYTFERLIHPRTLFIILPIFGMTFYMIKKSINNITSSKTPSKLDLVDAWFNETTQRYETAAPWNKSFNKSKIVKVSKKIVFESDLPN